MKKEDKRAGKDRERHRPQFRDRAIVIRSRKLGEADRVVVFLAEKEGKKSAVAKGIRKTSSRFGGRLEPCTLVDVLVYRGRDLGIIRQVEVIESFREIREDLARFSYASAMLDLAEKATHEGEASDIFSLLLASFKELKSESGSLPFLLSMFDLKVLLISGFGPVLDRCVSCGAAIDGNRPLFSLKMGGILCEKCGAAGGEDTGKRMRIHRQAIYALSWMGSHRMNEWRDYKEGLRYQGEVSNLTERFLEYWFEREFKSRRMLRLLNRGD